ncbi:MAG: PilZ domain-containing protein [Nitrospira sp.]
MSAASQPTRTTTDRRQTYRITVTQSLRVTVKDTTPLAGEATLRNLSDSGCSLHSETPLSVGDRLALVLDLPLPALVTDARIIWSNETVYGFEFVRISPIERTKLRRFLWTQISLDSIDDLRPSIQSADLTVPGADRLRLVP